MNNYCCAACEERAKSRNDARKDQLFKWSVITAAVCIVLMYLGIAIGGYQAAASSPAVVAPTKAPRLTRPQLCERLVRTPEQIEQEWDPVTETYPTNHAWRKCMGVERR